MNIRGFMAILLLAVLASPSPAGDTLYNGIELPDEWPPRMKHLPLQLPAPPYLVHRPQVVPIDVGRQLFVDNFLIEQSNMTRRFHKPVYHPANPILTYDKEWEMSKRAGGLPTACPYSGGIWYDPDRKKFRMWYMGGYIEHLCLAESDDGIDWVKPSLDVIPGTNIVLHRGATESNSLLMDLEEKDPRKRFKYFLTNISKGWKTEYRYSADGVHWSDPQWLSGPHGDRTTVFYNPFRKRWVFSLRSSDRSGNYQGRSKKYWETADIGDASTVQWPASASSRFDAEAPLWVSADRGLDIPRTEVGISPQLYQLDCVAYESLMLGMFSILRGDFHENDGDGRDAYSGRPKCAEVCMGYSRDGFHWYRPTHETFAGVSENRGDWNWGNIQPAGNSFVVVGDNLYFYVSGRRGAGKYDTEKNTNLLNAAYAGCSTGLAILRRDGFASMDAGGEPKTLTTRKVRFGGSRLFVNIDAPQGNLQVEVLDANGTVIAPFTKANCNAIRADKTLQAVSWKGNADLSHLAGKPVRFRFHLTDGQLYSFWVSPDKNGASNGYVAGGGPGFTANQDTVGIKAYAGNRAPLADGGSNQTIRDTDGDGRQKVELDGSASLDNDGTVAGFLWHTGGKQIAAGPRPAVELPVGTHTITLSVKDNRGAAGYANVTVTVKPKTDPVVSPKGLVMWLKADSIKNIANGSPLAKWKDSSANGMHAAQKEANKRPIWVKEGIGGQPAVRFDGKDDNLLLDHYPGLFHNYYKSSVFVVVRPQDGGAIISQAHANLSVSPADGGNLSYGSYHLTTEKAASWPQVQSAHRSLVPPGRAAVCTMIRSGEGKGDIALLVNGKRNDNGNAIPYHKVSPIQAYVGCAYKERNPWKGDIAEIIIYGRALSEKERKAVEVYLERKYRIDDSLSSR